ncbi:CoA transferase subunit A [Aeromicrobium wangtongii]|uniref:CoA transferase subunit A n=1 Tax=Aeromicrobium wangtongii TaxID=2969247 RepID=A0ABY5M7I8_9ACTN|nr:CoA transferase subunit A [Aeromicrobium wangtongii]MCD9199070.1 CoA transferase subunit A [Aeromicrobium wangtongii]UUP12899.1 CoA transferase subunit A [Aeromicrobium wangtongii]
MDKLVTSAAEAIADIPHGATVAVGGFGTSGVPWALVRALRAQGASGLTVVTNNCGVNGAGLAMLLHDHRIERVIASYIGQNKEFARQYLAGEIEVEFNPQGTLAERLRAGGAGIAAFYTPTGVGTLVADGGLPRRHGPGGEVVTASPPKEVRRFTVDGRERDFVLEEGIVTDFALVRAAVADRHGNAIFHAAARNFNPDVAMAGRVTVVEAQKIVEPGMLDPDMVHLSGVFVQRVVEVPEEIIE